MLKKSISTSHDVLVIGGGAAGLAAALAVRACGLAVAVIAGERRPPADGRCIALMQPALDELASLGVEEDFEAAGTRLAAIRIIDATGALFRAPTVTFRSSEIALDRFGLAVPADKIIDILRRKAAAADVALLDEAARTIGIGADGVRIETASAVLEGSLAIGADGARSAVREAAGTPTRAWTYPQEALTFIVAHELDHDDISTEFHTREGPFTLVPNGARESSVVWMVSPLHARRLMALDDEAFALAAERQCGSILGRLRLRGARGRYPMRGLVTPDPTGPRTMLVGEAAHVFPPIGAQGLNLGLRDVAALRKVLAGAPSDPGAPAILKRYADSRRLDLIGRTMAVDTLNRSLLTGFLPVQMLRSAGMSILQAMPPLRRAVMRAGIG